MITETPMEKDYERIAEIYNEAVKPFYAIYSEEEKEAHADSLVETTEGIRELASRRDLLVLRDSINSIVGFAAFRKKNDTVVWISELYIDPKEQGRGYGTVLIHHIEQYTQKAGCTVIALETHKDALWALHFYKKNGYEIVNEKVSDFPYSEILEKPPVANRPLIAKILG